MSIPFPRYLWHITNPKNKQSILDKGLIGKNGEWAIYLSHRPDSWKGLVGNHYCLFRVETKNLDRESFTSVDIDLDETLYWGKIPSSEITLVEEL